jgi:hypothetical protein
MSSVPGVRNPSSWASSVAKSLAIVEKRIPDLRIDAQPVDRRADPRSKLGKPWALANIYRAQG